MALARAVVTATLALRNDAGINVRQPLAALTVVVGTGGVDEATLRSVEAIILDEVNVKRLVPVSAESGAIARSAKPNFKALGRRLGKQMKAAGEAIRALGPEAIARYEAEGALELALPDGAAVTLGAGDLEITSEGVGGQPVRQETGGGFTVTVALETALDDALRAEGLAREVVNRVQNLRKSAGYHVADRITLAYAAGDEAAEALVAHAEYIRTETLALALERSDAPPSGDAQATLTLGGAEIALAVRAAGRTDEGASRVAALAGTA